MYYNSNEASCAGYVPEMNGSDGGCLDDDAGWSPDDGADDTAGEPFGDVSVLIDCSGTDCSLDPDLILNVV